MVRMKSPLLLAIPALLLPLSLHAAETISKAEDSAIKGAPAPAVTTSKPAVPAPETDSLDSPRHRAFYFVEHVALPSAWFKNTNIFDDNLQTQGKAMLSNFFVAAGKRVNLPDAEYSCDAETVDLGNGYTGWLLTFPEPSVTTESKYSLLLRKGDELRFFAWEYDNFGDSVSWYCCEWTAEHSHLNYGNTAEGSREAFLKRVKTILGEKTDPAAATHP